VLVPAPLANERINVMNDATIGRDQIEEGILSFEVSDEAMEAAAEMGKAAYTLLNCTGLTECPG
jgi:hypothetical protein